MSSPTTSEQAELGLVVPVDVVALCVGVEDADRATGTFAGSTAVYTRQVTREREAFLGANVDRGFGDEPWEQLRAGVHLHWALPDGLTHAAVVDGALRFPPAPNRWLVTRIVLDGAAASSPRSWLVESDVVLSARPAGQSPVTVPVADRAASGRRAGVRGSAPGAAGATDFGYLGRWHALDDAWTPASVRPAPSLREVAGTELTAVANGEVGFAAYYPACASVFGFHDTLADLPLPLGRPAQLTYGVVGWYQDPRLDPVQPGSTAAQLAEAYGWTFDAPGSPSFSLYSGLVEGIAWDPRTRYVLGRPVRGPLRAQAALGNTPAEALAAHFTARDHPGTPLFESLLSAFQLGLLDGFAQPRPDQLTALDEGLHDAAFAQATTAVVHEIVPADPTGPAVELTPELAEDLNLLNELSERSARCRARLDWTRWQLFADWYRIFEIDSNRRNEAFMIAYARYGDWDALVAECASAARRVAEQLAVVRGRLTAAMRLDEAPVERFHQPSDPVVVLTGEGLELPPRHGGDGRYDERRLLACRTTDQLLSAASVRGTAIEASRFSGVRAPRGLPRAELATTLLREACLLDTRLAATIAGGGEPALRTALERALAGERQDLWRFTGTAPSPIEVNWFAIGVWLPLFASWRAEWLPLHPTAIGRKPASYPPRFFADNFSVDQDAGGAIAYAPGRDGIHVDPATARFPQTYRAGATLSPTAPETLARLLAGYLDTHTDATLAEVLRQLRGAEFVTAPLSGLTELLLMRRQTLQLDVAVPPGSDYEDFTTEVNPAVGRANTVGPDFGGDFNPLRAGWLKLSLELVDAYGQKRAVDVPELVVADAMRTVVEERPVPSVAYLPPRLAARSRLLFRWLGASPARREQATNPPATSPVCGWLVPDHLDGSLFLYDGAGRALGTLSLLHDAGGPAVGWQGAPGVERTIDQPIEVALELVDPRLRALGLALASGTRAFFTAFWRALDTVASNVDPTPLSTDTGLVALVGRPIALTQAALRLEVEGRPPRDIGWDALSDRDTDDGLSEVELPVVLGNLRRLSDGLIGYFKQAGEEYDLTTFYTQGATRRATRGVVAPTQETLALRISPPLDGGDDDDEEDRTERLLMLVDPRGAVHATTGYLPTASLALAPDQVNGGLSTLDLSFFTAPVLRGDGGLTLPVPQEPGFQTAWVEQVRLPGDRRAWSVTPEIDQPAGRAVWSYTPQQITEGWLRLNPVLLSFDLLDAEDKPIVVAGRANDLTLHVVNRSRRAIAFDPGSPVPEGGTPAGSVFYVHFGALVAEADVARIAFSAPGWTFQRFSRPRRGAYWAAAPNARVALRPDEALEIAVTNVLVSEHATEGRVYFDYYAIDGLNDGIFADALTVQTTAVRSHR